jgi:hypothetical protein
MYKWITNYLHLTHRNGHHNTKLIENIATSALIQVNVLRKLKFTLSKQALSNINNESLLANFVKHVTISPASNRIFF